MDDDGEERPASPLRAVIALLLVVGLIVAVLFIGRRLRDAAWIQDCVASGRTNCVTIEAPER